MREDLTYFLCLARNPCLGSRDHFLQWLGEKGFFDSSCRSPTGWAVASPGLDRWWDDPSAVATAVNRDLKEYYKIILCEKR